MNYDAFIDYSKSDIREARYLRRALERFRIPKGLSEAKGPGGVVTSRSRLTIFFPKSADDDLHYPKLEESAFLVVLCSRRSARDTRTDERIRAFKALGRPNHILAVIVDGEPNAADGIKGFTADDECFPDALKYDLGADGELDPNQRIEPIAADVRRHKDGRKAAVLKIIAGLLGVGFDDLYHREQRRQQRNRTMIMTASLALAVVLGILAVRAFRSERQSRSQLAKTREVNTYIESLFTNVDRPALQKMDPKLMSLILESAESKLDKANPPPAPDLEAEIRQILGQAYLACGVWDKAIANLRRSLDLWEPIIGRDSSPALITRRDLGEALIGAGKPADAKDLLSQVSPSGMTVVRYELARALALTGDDTGAGQLLAQEIAARPEALAQALKDPAFISIRASLPAPKQ